MSTDAVQVLTVHAAKGLEWDVVAVPGLVEGSFPARSSAGTSYKDGQWRIEPAHRQGLVRWPLRRALRPAWRPRRAPGARLATAPDLEALEDETSRFVSDGGEHGIEEERRLAYVAFTRARSD